MQAWVLEVMEQYGYLGVAMLIAIENLFPPIPSEVILTFGGFMTSWAGLNIWGVIAAATAGSMFGAAVLYALGAGLGSVRTGTLLSGRFGKALHLHPEQVADAAQEFAKKGFWAVFFCRFVPVVRSLISIPAGFARVPLLPFTLLTLAGSVVWNTVLVFLGAALGASWQMAEQILDGYTLLALAALGTGVLAFWAWQQRRRC